MFSCLTLCSSLSKTKYTQIGAISAVPLLQDENKIPERWLCKILLILKGSCILKKYGHLYNWFAPLTNSPPPLE